MVAGPQEQVTQLVSDGTAEQCRGVGFRKLRHLFDAIDINRGEDPAAGAVDGRFSESEPHRPGRRFAGTKESNDQFSRVTSVRAGAISPGNVDRTAQRVCRNSGRRIPDPWGDLRHVIEAHLYLDARM